MKFKKVNSQMIVVQELKARLTEHLGAGERVFWLVPGGSGLDIAVQVSKLLKNQPGLDLLTVSLTDERYGPIGHPDSNWRQLMDKGFKINGARLLPVLDGSSLAANAKRYSVLLNKELSAADYSVALAGLGPDGHIFGIKPGSPATTSNDDVIGYAWDDYQRLTPTINLIKKLDEVFVYTAGQEKHRQIADLARNIAPPDQPAQYLKQLSDVTIYNDYKGE